MEIRVGQVWYNRGRYRKVIGLKKTAAEERVEYVYWDEDNPNKKGKTNSWLESFINKKGTLDKRSVINEFFNEIS